MTMPIGDDIARELVLVRLFFILLTSHFLADLLAQQTGGLDQQHHDQHGEHDGVCTAGWRYRPWPKISMMPSRMPPSMAPGMEPMPPNTAAVKALMPGMEPVVGIRVG